MAKDNEEFSMELIRHIGVVGDYKNKTKELNIVKWGDGAPTFDLRNWDKKDHKAKRGITLTAEELQKLKDIIDAVLAE